MVFAYINKSKSRKEGELNSQLFSFVGKSLRRENGLFKYSSPLCQELLSDSYFVCSADVDQLPSESWYKQIFLVYLPVGCSRS